MSKSPFRERRFAPLEVRRIVRRAAEVAEHDAGTASAERALTQEEIERLGGELGLPATAIRRAIAGDAGEAGQAPSPPATRRHIAFDDELDGELSASFDEDIVEAIEAATGHAGRTQVVGRTLTWTPMSTQPRHLTISVRSRDGKTRLRIDESLAQQFYGMYVGLGVGVGFGFGSVAFGLGMALGQPLLGIALLLVVLGGALLLGRAAYRKVVARRTSELEALRARLHEIVQEGIATTKAPAPRARIGARQAEVETEAEVEAEAQAEAEAAAKASVR